MKGSAFKLGNVATKSALKNTGAEYLKGIRDGGIKPRAEDRQYATKHDEIHAANDPNNPAHEGGDATFGQPDKDKEEETAPTKMKSPMKQGGVLECTECDWTDESLGEPMDSAIINAHYMSEHSSPGPGTGTPGYVSPKDPWGTNWGDAPNTKPSKPHAPRGKD